MLSRTIFRDYVQAFDGGYFYALPGVTDENDWYGRRLLA